MVPATKKYELCGLELEFEEKLDQLFKGVVATDKYACAPSETGFGGTPENVVVILSCDSPNLHSQELLEIQSTNRSNCPLVEVEKRVELLISETIYHI